MLATMPAEARMTTLTELYLSAAQPAASWPSTPKRRTAELAMAASCPEKPLLTARKVGKKSSTPR